MPDLALLQEVSHILQHLRSVNPVVIIVQFIEAKNLVVEYLQPWYTVFTYRQISNISHSKSQNLNVSRLVLQLHNPGVKLRMKM